MNGNADKPLRIARAAWLGVGLLVFISTYWRYRFLTQVAEPVGVDGYYYAVQVRSILSGEGLYYPAAPLGLWLMAIPSYFVGPVAGVKLTAAFVPALIALPVFGIVLRVGRHPAIAALAACLCATSQSSLFLSAEFVKTGMGMSFAAFAVWSAVSCQSPRALVRTVLLFLATLLTHKLAFALAGLFVAPLLWPRMRQRWPFVVAALALLAVLGIVAPERFAGRRELALLAGLFRTSPDFSLPALSGGGGVYLGWDGVFAAISLLFAIPAWRCSPRGLVLGLALCVGFISLPWLNVAETDGLGFRLRGVSFLPASILVGLGLVGVIDFVKTRVSAPAASELGRLASVGCLAVALALLVFRAHQPRTGVVFAHPAMAAAVANAAAHADNDDVFISPDRQIMFMVSYMSGRPARLSPGSVPEARRAHLLPLGLMTPDFAIAVADLRRAQERAVPLPISLDPRHKNGLLLMRSSTWEYLLRASRGGR